ncbi:alpha/beta fold hydrolase [Ktedonosporobacter rubrisoli]|uniref:Alpha/beta fold hydrolase n=1 Tax=Ktedonosporobacter rubrisoli TaxID=2509675 RepID=A0A4P6JL37_KTERU|nr:alpha/beta fold hydrolase [Ktedonosporobacter rubrisoli]QBD75702.1 alpha/beta fold hydrolase [Ktedonosporobacter rubrisoli]
MTLQTMYLTLATAPARILFYGTARESAQRGTILFYHGFGQSKDDYSEVLEQLARAGFLIVSLDGIGHGARRYPDFAQRFPPHSPHLEGNMQLEAAFLDVVQATTQEIPAIIDALFEHKLAHPGRLGITGYSFGGFVSYAAVIKDKRLQAAAPVVGAPEWKLARPESPHQYIEQFFPTAILSQVAGQDRRVSPLLAPYYAQAPARLRYIEYPASPHELCPQDWSEAWQAVVAWFINFLPSADRL